MLCVTWDQTLIRWRKQIDNTCFWFCWLHDHTIIGKDTIFRNCWGGSDKRFYRHHEHVFVWKWVQHYFRSHRRKRKIIDGVITGCLWRTSIYMGPSGLVTHWGRDKMAAISQTTFSSALSCMKMFECRFEFLKFVPKGPINNIPALVQIMAWRRPGDKPLSEPMMVRLPTHICVTRPQWVNWYNLNIWHGYEIISHNLLWLSFLTHTYLTWLNLQLFK